ncbi:hypothetical protein [Brachybacterium sp. AOP29-B2-41]|uniref:hypothetical protein n=1 Tax=Brachybacterium sp. AOP29-B2-41 TaxID=3457704 RepID=UPI004034BC97
MPSPSFPQLICAAAAASAVGAISLVEHRRLGPWSHGAFRVGMAALTGALVADSSRHDQALLDPVRDGIVAGGVTLGLMDLIERLDGAVVDGLRGAGVRHPRALLATLGAVGTAAMIVAPGAFSQSERWGTLEETFGESESRPLPEDVQTLLTALLTPPEHTTDLPGAAALREQLASARIVDLGYPSSDVQFEVEDPQRLAVPRQQVWPLRAAFMRDGFRYELELQIDDGCLGMLSVMVPDDEPRHEDAHELLSSPEFALPEVSEITLEQESEQPQSS